MTDKLPWSDLKAKDESDRLMKVQIGAGSCGGLCFVFIHNFGLFSLKILLIGFVISVTIRSEN